MAAMLFAYGSLHHHWRSATPASTLIQPEDEVWAWISLPNHPSCHEGPSSGPCLDVEIFWGPHPPHQTLPWSSVLTKPQGPICFLKLLSYQERGHHLQVLLLNICFFKFNVRLIRKSNFSNTKTSYFPSDAKNIFPANIISVLSINVQHMPKNISNVIHIFRALCSFQGTL